jgi:hypothetical protein
MTRIYGRKPPMDIAIRKRLAIALASKGLNMERVSLAACLSQTYAHDVIKRRRERSLHLEIQLWLILGDGVNQAADLVSGTTSIPSRNLTPLMTFGN